MFSQQVAGFLARAGRLEVHDARDARVHAADVDGAAGFEGDRVAGVAQGREQGKAAFWASGSPPVTQTVWQWNAATSVRMSASAAVVPPVKEYSVSHQLQRRGSR
jgi:hypothetical protein